MIRLLLSLLAISLAAAGLVKIMRHNSMSLAENEKLNNAQSSSTEDSKDEGISSTDNSDGAGSDGADNHNDEETSATDNPNDAEISGADSSGTEYLQNAAEMITPVSFLTGSSFNGASRLASKTAHAEGFYYEPLSDALRQYMTGISYPGTGTQSEADDSDTAPQGAGSAPIPEISLDELRCANILHCGFDGNPAEGELIYREHLWHVKRTVKNGDQLAPLLSQPF